jgi:hypothetical protein
MPCRLNLGCGSLGEKHGESWQVGWQFVMEMAEMPCRMHEAKMRGKTPERPCPACALKRRLRLPARMSHPSYEDRPVFCSFGRFCRSSCCQEKGGLHDMIFTYVILYMTLRVDRTLLTRLRCSCKIGLRFTMVDSG